MANQTANPGVRHPIVPGDKRRHLQRRPDESESAHAARIAYCQLEPGKRTIAAAYRSVKGRPLDADVKTPGYFGAWAKRFHWKEYAAAWDAYNQGLTAQPEDDQLRAQLTAARQRTVKQAEALQALIQQEIERLKESGRRPRLWPGSSNTDRTTDLANLAAALKDSSAAHLAALGGTEPDDG